MLSFCTSFGAILGGKLGSKPAQKETKNGTSFGARSLRISGVWESPKRKINERDEKGKASGNIVSKRTGGDFISFHWKKH